MLQHRAAAVDVSDSGAMLDPGHMSSHFRDWKAIAKNAFVPFAEISLRLRQIDGVIEEVSTAALNPVAGDHISTVMECKKLVDLEVERLGDPAFVCINDQAVRRCGVLGCILIDASVAFPLLADSPGLLG